MSINKNNYEAFLLDYIEGNLSAELTAELLLFLQQHPEIESGIDDFKIISVNENENISFSDKNFLKRKEFVINDDLMESLIISLVNRDLTKEEENKLMERINNDSTYKSLLDHYQKTKLAAGDEKLTDKVLLKGHLPITHENIEYFIIAETEGELNSVEKKELAAFKASYPGVKNLSEAYTSVYLNKNEIHLFENKSSLKKKEGVVISFYTFLQYGSVAAAACLILYFSFFNGEKPADMNGFASRLKNPVFEEEKNNAELIADKSNEIEIVNENPVAEENKFIPVDKKENSNQIAKEEPKKVLEEKRIDKEPKLDDFANENQSIGSDSLKEKPVLFTKVELPEIKNDAINEESVSANTNLASLNEDDYISPGRYVRNWAKKTFFIEEANEKHDNQTTELADNTMRLKGTDATIKKAEGKDYKEYGFSIGKFSFNRKVRK